VGVETTSRPSLVDVAAPVGDDAVSVERLDPVLGAAWDELAVATGAPPFIRPGWISAWVEAFARPDDLHVMCVRRGGILVGVLPVRRRRGAAVGVCNPETPAFDAVAIDDRVTGALAQMLLRRHAGRVDLSFLPADGPIARGFRDVLLHDRPGLWRSQRSQPYVDVGGTWQAYEADKLSTRRKRDLRRLRRRLDEMGDLDFVVESGGERLDALVEEGFTTEARGWKGRAGTAVLSREASRTFYASVARWSATVGILRLAFLRLDGQPLAFSFAFEQGGVHYGLKLCYDEELARLSPGIVLLHHLLQRGFTDPDLHRFEMLGEADDYKLEFSHGCAEQFRLQVFRPGLHGLIDGATISASGRARQMVRERVPTAQRKRIAQAMSRVRVV
jgi:CelD/BcsL family acetyltransferase involved in cellulose biosynthesis